MRGKDDFTMNLLELSKSVGMPPEKLKDTIAEQFQIFILSDYAPLREDLLQAFGADETSSQNVKPPDTLGSVSVTTSMTGEDTALLEQLEQTLNPELAYTRKLLNYCVHENFLIIIDLCSLLHEQFYAFYNLFKPIAQQGNARLIVPYVVVEEMKRMLIRRSKKKDVLDRCEKVMKFLLPERDAGIVEFVGSEEDVRTNQKGQQDIHADSLLLEKIMYFRNEARSVLLITQDHNFSVDALHLNHMQSSITNAVVLAKKIVRKGALTDNADDTLCPPLPI